MTREPGRGTGEDNLGNQQRWGEVGGASWISSAWWLPNTYGDVINKENKKRFIIKCFRKKQWTWIHNDKWNIRDKKEITKERCEQSVLLINDTYHQPPLSLHTVTINCFRQKSDMQTNILQRAGVGVYSWESQPCCEAAMCNVQQTQGKQTHTYAHTKYACRHIPTHRQRDRQAHTEGQSEIRVESQPTWA